MATDSISKNRLDALRKLLGQGALSTQEELADKLGKMNFSVTQSTISRDLRKLGAVKAIDPTGRTVYRLSDSTSEPIITTSLRDLILDIQDNGAIIVILTTPGSASLIARHLDRTKPQGILGTIAGDDTIFVAPVKITQVKQVIKNIEESFNTSH